MPGKLSFGTNNATIVTVIREIIMLWQAATLSILKDDGETFCYGPSDYQTSNLYEEPGAVYLDRQYRHIDGKWGGIRAADLRGRTLTEALGILEYRMPNQYGQIYVRSGKPKDMLPRKMPKRGQTGTASSTGARPLAMNRPDTKKVALPQSIGTSQTGAKASGSAQFSAAWQPVSSQQGKSKVLAQVVSLLSDEEDDSNEDDDDPLHLDSRDPPYVRKEAKRQRITSAAEAIELEPIHAGDSADLTAACSASFEISTVTREEGVTHKSQDVPDIEKQHDGASMTPTTEFPFAVPDDVSSQVTSEAESYAKVLSSSKDSASMRTQPAILGNTLPASSHDQWTNDSCMGATHGVDDDMGAQTQALVVEDESTFNATSDAATPDRIAGGTPSLAPDKTAAPDTVIQVEVTEVVNDADKQLSNPLMPMTAGAPAPTHCNAQDLVQLNQEQSKSAALPAAISMQDNADAGSNEVEETTFSGLGLSGINFSETEADPAATNPQSQLTEVDRGVHDKHQKMAIRTDQVPKTATQAVPASDDT